MNPASRAIWLRLVRDRQLRWVLPMFGFPLAFACLISLRASLLPSAPDDLQMMVGWCGMMAFCLGIFMHAWCDESRTLLIPQGIRPGLIAFALLLTVVELVPGAIIAKTMGLDPVDTVLVMITAIGVGVYFAMDFADALSAKRMDSLIYSIFFANAVFLLTTNTGHEVVQAALLSPLHPHPEWSWAEKLLCVGLLTAMAVLTLVLLRLRILQSVRRELVSRPGAAGEFAIIRRWSRPAPAPLLRTAWSQVRHCAGGLPGRLGDVSMIAIILLLAVAGGAMGWFASHGSGFLRDYLPPLAFMVIMVQWLVRAEVYQAAEAVRADALRPWTRARFLWILLGTMLWTSMATVLVVSAPIYLMLACWVTPTWSWLPWILAPFAIQPWFAGLLSWHLVQARGFSWSVVMGVGQAFFFTGLILVCTCSGLTQAVLAHPVPIETALFGIGMGGLLLVHRWLMRADFG